VKSKTAVWFALPATLLVMAIFPLPYGYYTFLRIVVTLAAGAAAVVSYRAAGRIQGITVLAVIIAIAFNPIVPVFLTRELWLPIDLLAAGFFGFLAWRGNKQAAIPKVTDGEN
jgi:hypothetical protein